MPKNAAEKIAKAMKEISIAEFFEKNRHLLGFDNPSKALLMVVKEAVDNSLDACEEARILPEIIVKIKKLEENRFKVIVEDNGPGIVKEKVPEVFGKLLFGSKFHLGRQTRGQQGIGISAAVLYAQLTTGKPAVIISRTSPDKPAYVFHIKIDILKNKPIVLKEEKTENFREHGVRVELEIEGRYVQKHHSVDEYLKQTAIINPHARIIYYNPNGEKIEFKRSVDHLPPLPKIIKPHPHGVEFGIFERMIKITSSRTIASFLTNDFSRIGRDTAVKICVKAGIKPDKPPHKLTHEEIEKLYKVIQQTKFIAPPLDCLSPLGEEEFKKGIQQVVKPEFVVAVSRPTTVYRGNPFKIEACIAWGGEIKAEGPAKIMRFANRVPLLYQSGACAITKAVQEVNWSNYDIPKEGNMPTGPIVIAVHMASVWIPYTSESKEAIASYPEIVKEIKLALQECGRKLAAYLRKQRRLQEREMKRKIFERYIPEVAASLSILTGENKETIIKYLELIAIKNIMKGEGEKHEHEKEGSNQQT
ncbi:MAG TPA: DNA topoisomerase VI subunit B [Nanoarchaeota archaeon]|nr:DNA topoisomerase VI subunit B [Nanoarchaeota archaeon]